MKKQSKKYFVITLTSFLLIILTIIMILHVFNLNKYGIKFLCSCFGGIWCYWPSLVAILEFTSFVLTIIILLLIFSSKIKKSVKSKNKKVVG